MTGSGARPASGFFLWRYFIPLAAFVVIGVVLPLLLVIPEQRSILRESARASAVTTAEIAGHALATAVGTGKVADVKDQIAALKHAYPAFGRMSVTSRTGKVIAHTDPSQEGKLEVDLFPPPVSTMVQTVRGRDGAQLLDVTVPLVFGSDVRGTMQTEMRVENPVTGSWVGIQHLSALTACLLGLGFLVSLRLARAQTTAPVIVRERVVTERNEEKLAAPPQPLNELLLAVVEATPSALLVVDEVTRTIMHANGAFCRLWGLEDLEQEMRRTDADYDTVAARCNAAAEQPVFPSPLGSTELDPLRLVDAEIRCRDGRVVHCFSLPLAHGGRHVRLYVCSDVSAQRRREDDLTTATMATRAALQSKAAFLTQVSRTLRAPLNGLIGTVGLLSATTLTAQQETYVDTARGSAADVLAMVENILDLSAIDAGELHLVAGDLDLRQLVHESVEPFALTAHRKSIELVWTVADALPRTVCGDRDRLRQVLTNLVSSAVHASDHGEIVVHVSAAPADVATTSAALHIGTDGARTRAQSARRAATRVTLRFEVRDSGHGISPNEQASLLQIMNADAADAQCRTHLPLLTAKRLVELMDGQVGVESDPGRGSTLWFTVPLQVDPQGANEAMAPVDAFNASRVLIVDDNTTVRTVLEEQLRTWHITSESAADGAEALRRLRAAVDYGTPYALAIIDAQMPEMDGLALADAIRREVKLADLPLFLMNPGGPTPAEGHPGIALTLNKPVRPSLLYDALVSHVGKNGDQRRTVPSRAAARKGQPRGHLLLAEDNLVNQKIALRMLDKLGYQTDVVANGREAVEAAQRTHYDAILMDCQMPEMDGVTAAATIRRQEGVERHVPIVAVTANSMDADRERCLAAGMDDFLAKPVRSPDLETVLARWTADDPLRDRDPLRIEGQGSVIPRAHLA